ncbi:AzlD domain-containing protein [Donghicola sp. C2-DW-16]|uniref:AzlD domain-containing protein n=1 Tax=Donghicola mangrovi TaxID=2729614 RepID=A0ABX2PI68_9RHOB|nr:AzlD domain-containing protein [Donghicola mangrovi]NVO28596.1 AzlD domain-containing protein [Donghicola mangrovi]
MISDLDFWILTIALGIGTFLIRFSFLGIFGGRQMPDWALLHLRYVGVAVFPAIFTPLVVWPPATDGQIDPIRLTAALAALLVGLRVNVIFSIIAGMATFYVLRFIF